MTITQERHDTDLRTSNESGAVAHIIQRPDQKMSPQAYVLQARVEGVPLIALCGYAWVPHRDATKLPVCEACKEIYESEDRTAPDGNGGLPEAG